MLAGPVMAQEAAPSATPPDQTPAQTPAKAPAPTPKAVEEVTVTATASSAVRTAIDRRSYSVAGDLQGSTGSVSDALRNVPSVDVDVQGNLSLRGNANVTVMVDGQKSTMFSGPGGAQALQSMSADQIERVEVITNPTAATSADGTAGIINLIMKKNRKPGLNGGVRANVGTGGRGNVSGNVVYTAGKLTLSGDAGARRDTQIYHEDTTSISTDPTTSKVVTVQEPDFQNGSRDNWNGHVGAEYALDDKTRLSGDLRANGFGSPSQLGIDSTTTTPGAPAQVFQQRGEVRDDLSHATGQATLRRTFAGDEHDLTVVLSRDETHYGEGDGFTETPALTPPFQDQHIRITADLTELKADYNKPVGKAGKLKTGYDLTVTDDGSNNDTTHGTGPADAVSDPLSRNLYTYRQMVNAAYATFEQPLGQWTILAGLRVEDEQLRLHEDIQNLTVSRDDLRVFPSLHLSYQATESQQWILSYTSRIQRPGPFQLDPFVNRFDPLNPGTGNPLLKPQETRSFEGGWQYKRGSTSYLATLFYRSNVDEVGNVTIPEANGVLLWTLGNAGSSTNAGLELVASGPLLGKTLTYNVSTDIYWNDIRAPLFGVQTQQSSISATLRGSLDWQATKKDQFQINGQLSPRRLSPQGYNDPRFLLFLGYKHKFNDAWSAVVTVQDPFDIYRWRYGLAAPDLSRVTTGHTNVQAAFVGFTYTFGGAKSAAKSDPGFDFNTGSSK
jgi:outer membrane receptor protein involved in Fe transport